MKRQKRNRLAIAIGACALFSLCAQAAERVTLSNGFTMNCDHHTLVDGQMRLYLSAGESSYIVLKLQEITGV